MTKSQAQTGTEVATINCQENAPDEKLIPYPDLPAQLDNSPLPVNQATVDALQSYSNAQIAWGVATVGSFKNERDKRAVTRDCITGLRTRGIIN